jgi:hypothetical protein
MAMIKKDDETITDQMRVPFMNLSPPKVIVEPASLNLSPPQAIVEPRPIVDLMNLPAPTLVVEPAISLNLASPVRVEPAYMNLSAPNPTFEPSYKGMVCSPGPRM